MTISTEDHTIVKFVNQERDERAKQKASEAEGRKTMMQLMPRETNHTNDVIVIGVCFLLFGIILVFLYKIIFESLYYILTLAAFAFIFLLVLFPLKVLLANIVNLLGSLNALDLNSKYYSAIEPMPPVNLPHVTIQIPVCTEDLCEVIEPTVRDVMAAMKYYRKQGLCSV